MNLKDIMKKISKKIKMTWLYFCHIEQHNPQKYKAIIPTFQENGKVVYSGMDSTLDKEQKKQKIINTLEEIFRVFERDKMNLQNEKNRKKNQMSIICERIKR